MDGFKLPYEVLCGFLGRNVRGIARVRFKILMLVFMSKFTRVSTSNVEDFHMDFYMKGFHTRFHMDFHMYYHTDFHGDIYVEIYVKFHVKKFFC